MGKEKLSFQSNQTKISTKDIGEGALWKEKENMFGKMGHIIKEIIKMGKSKATESFILLLEGIIVAIGKMENRMGSGPFMMR
jgi:hypothetical protein